MNNLHFQIKDKNPSFANMIQANKYGFTPTDEAVQIS